jgi:hypothetical protein
VDTSCLCEEGTESSQAGDDDEPNENQGSDCSAVEATVEMLPSDPGRGCVYLVLRLASVLEAVIRLRMEASLEEALRMLDCS